MESERTLLYCYRRFNTLWFNDELPEDVLIYYDAIGKAYGDANKLETGESVIRLCGTLRAGRNSETRYYCTRCNICTCTPTRRMANGSRMAW